ncbi:MAG: arylsulfatase A-like enzyme/Tfp pilus assembly protein PilF [Planctomycetota bacterium]|jgi:arylsulfatase A-like enzyme/Tfp pilus assembly protein PilF
MLKKNLAAWTASLGISLLGSCTDGGRAGPDAPLSVVFISIDTLRADRVGCYGNDVVGTPAIDRLASEGTRFETCVASCPLTLPSHSTMMTGTYPFVHGARVNGSFVLAEENLTLAEILSEAGYVTHAEVSAAVLEAEYGFDQGFDSYNDTFEDPQPQSPVIRIEEVRHGTQRVAEPTTDGALAFLESRRDLEQPFFLFVHYFDPHQPYQAPAPFSEKYGDGYLAEIAYTDTQIARVLEVLRSPQFAERTLIVLTSDHGDGLMQHKESTHGTFLYDSTLMVPLIFHSPGRVPVQQVVQGNVGHADLLPTILELLELEQPSDLQGVSLLPLIKNPKASLDLKTYAETLEPRTTFGYSELRALRHGPWKYIHGPRPELYQVEDDPNEAHDLALVEEEQLEVMRRALRGIIESAPPLLGRGEQRILDKSGVQNLAALGYVSTVGAADEDDPQFWTDELAHFVATGVNPMDRASEILSLYTGFGQMRDGNFEEAIQWLLVFSTNNPDYALAHSRLAMCYASLRRPKDAIPELYRALELNPGDCDDQQMLGAMLAENGQLKEAGEQFEMALKCDPNLQLAALNLAKLQIMREDHAAALKTLNESLKRAPGHVDMSTLRIRLLACSPNAEVRNGKRAERLSAKLLAAGSNQHPGVLSAASAALAEQGSFGKAIELAQGALNLAKSAGATALATRIEQELAEFRAGRAIRSL